MDVRRCMLGVLRSRAMANHLLHRLHDVTQEASVVGASVVGAPHSHMASGDDKACSHVISYSTWQVSPFSSQAPAQAKPTALQYPVQVLYLSSKLLTSTLQSPQTRS